MPVILPSAGFEGYTSGQHPCSGTHDEGVYPQEAITRLLKVWNSIHVRRGKLSYDEGCMLYTGDYFTAHNVWSVVARCLNVPFLWYLPCNQYYRT